MATAISGATPKHLWVVGILSLLWNCFGAYAYTMSHTGGGGTGTSPIGRAESQSTICRIHPTGTAAIAAQVPVVPTVVHGALVAYDLTTGAERWRWKGPSPSHASPVLLKI